MLPEPFSLLPASAIKAQRYNAGEMVFREAQKTHAIYFVARGVVTLRRLTPSGTFVTIHRAAEGQFCAEASLFSDRYHCDAICVGGAELYTISKAATLKHLKADPEFALGLSMLLARQVQSYRQLLQITAIKSAHERVYAAVSAGLLSGSIMQFAQSLGLTHEATYRALSRLVKEGRLIKAERGQYSLCPPPTA